MRRDDATILDMVRACRLILDFTTGMDFAAFTADTRTQSAVLHQLMVLGEAVKRLSAEAREAHAEVPWNAVAGMRDKLIHAYDEVDLGQVWQTAQRDVPTLLRQLEEVLPGTGS